MRARRGKERKDGGGEGTEEEEEKGLRG